MTVHEGLVTRKQLMELRQSMWPQGVDYVVQSLKCVEPELAVSLSTSLRNALKQLDGCSVPVEIRDCMFETILALAVTAALAVRQNHRDLWEMLAKSTKLALIAPEVH